MGTSTDLHIGAVIDERYELLDVLGKGAYGIVYKARQISTGQNVAIKVLLEEKLQFSANANIEQARFEREMQLIAQLKHPNVVRLIDSGRLGNTRLFMALEFIDGVNLADLLKDKGALSPRVAEHLMSQVLDALSCAHEAGIVHRDLKPHNIMVTTTGSRRNAMVLDFGIAGLVESARSGDYQSLTAQSQIQGTPAYMAPEYIREKLTSPQGDIYAWGLVFLECLTGERAVTGANPLDIAMTQGSPVPVNIPDSIADPHLRKVLEHALAKPLDKRYPDATVAMRELEDRPNMSYDRIPAIDVGVQTPAPATPTTPTPVPPPPEPPPIRPIEGGSDAMPPIKTSGGPPTALIIAGLGLLVVILIAVVVILTAR